MGAVQRVSFEWNDHQPNITASFNDMLHNADLVDVTLTCDGQSIQAHKLVLSACSPYFRGLFQNHPVPHPVIFLVETHIDELKLLVEYMYNGKIKIPKGNMTQFVRLAQVLKVSGLDYLYEQVDEISSNLGLSEERGQTANIIERGTCPKDGLKCKINPIVSLNPLPLKTLEKFKPSSCNKSQNVNMSDHLQSKAVGNLPSNEGKINEKDFKVKNIKKDLTAKNIKKDLKAKSASVKERVLSPARDLRSKTPTKHDLPKKAITRRRSEPTEERSLNVNDSCTLTNLPGNNKRLKDFVPNDETDDSEIEVVFSDSSRTEEPKRPMTRPGTSHSGIAANPQVLERRPSSTRVPLARKTTGGGQRKRKQEGEKALSSLKKLKPVLDSSDESESDDSSRLKHTESSSSSDTESNFSTSGLKGLRPKNRNKSGFASEGERSRASVRLKQPVCYRDVYSSSSYESDLSD